MAQPPEPKSLNYLIAKPQVHRLNLNSENKILKNPLCAQHHTKHITRNVRTRPHADCSQARREEVREQRGLGVSCFWTWLQNESPRGEEGKQKAEAAELAPAAELCVKPGSRVSVRRSLNGLILRETLDCQQNHMKQCMETTWQAEQIEALQ